MKQTSLALPQREATILETVIQPSGELLPKAVARYLLSMKFRPEDTERINALSAKARDGCLSSEEAEDLDSYLRIGHMLSMMKSTARRSLKSTSARAHG
jgi:hypothetical protein